MAWRAAVIGCGLIGSQFSERALGLGVYSHAEAYHVCPDFTLAAVCDPDPDRLASCARRWGVAGAYARAGDLLAGERPAVVSICAPDPAHFELALLALDSPGLKALFMEKPLALDLDQARRIVELAEERGVVLAVNYLRRYSPAFQEARRRIRAGELGRLQAVGGYYTKGIRHNGSHWLDLVRWLVGEVASVQAWNGLGEAGDDPTLDLRLRFQDGPAGWLLGCRAEAYSVFELDILGEAGRLRLVDAQQVFESQRVGESAFYQGYRTLQPPELIEARLRDLLLRAVEDLAACLREPGRQPLCTGRDALAALAIAEAAADSALRGAEANPAVVP
jgi:predicted dehydrogenase